MKHRQYTEGMIEFAKVCYEEMPIKEIVPLFNFAFGTDVTEGQMKGLLCRHKARSGRTGQFGKGQAPWNAGKKGWQAGGRAKSTQFRAGHIPVNHRPVGSQRLSKDGYIEVKVSEPNVWRRMHQLVWEDNFGPIPDGHICHFKDNDKTNCSPSNLMLVTRPQGAVMNKMGLSKVAPELKQSAVQIVDLKLKLSEVSA